MTFKKIILSSVALAVAATAAQPAFAQRKGKTPKAIGTRVAVVSEPIVFDAKLEAGVQVNDASGAAVGTVTSVEGDFVVLKTDKYEARLPASSFVAAPGAMIFGMTQAQLNAEIEQSMAKPADFVTVGVTVRDTQGGVVGTVSEVDAEYATIQLATSSAVKLPLSAFGSGLQGPVIGATAAELEAQLEASAQ